MATAKSTRKSSKPPVSDDIKALAESFIIRKGQVFATSLDVAARFEKKHFHVLRSIQSLECSEGFRQSNFGLSSYLNEQGKPQPSYELTRDGFTMLAFGFTGKEAAEWREKYIAAFNWMEKELYRIKLQKQEPVWQQQRLTGKTARLELTDGIKEFVEYAKTQGSQNAERYYQIITKMEYRALFLVEKAVGNGFRDTLSAIQNANLTAAENIAQKALRDGMKDGMHYKAIFPIAKRRVEQFATLIQIQPALTGNRHQRALIPLALTQ